MSNLESQEFIKAIDNHDICPISKEYLMPSTTIATKCGHVFRKEALLKWLESHQFCPMDRCHVNVVKQPIDWCTYLGNTLHIFYFGSPIDAG